MSQVVSFSPDGGIIVPDRPVIPCIPGDGIGPEVWAAARDVLDAAVAKAYGGRRRIEWKEIPAGQSAVRTHGSALPDESLEAIRQCRVAIKGPLATPVGTKIRSVNVALRQTLDLYACIRPVAHIPGVPAPTRRPEDVDMVIFRENTEDVYMGIEWEEGSPEAAEVIALARRLTGKEIRPDSGVGLKPISRTGSRRLVRKAIRYALDAGRPSVTLVHKGNIMKFTEAAFCRWGYEVAAEEFADSAVSMAEVREKHGGIAPAGKVVVKDCIADAMFQEILLRPKEHSVLALPNLNGDYLSDALAATVGGLGMAPGANIGDGYAVFEATHGTAPDVAGQDAANPGSLILSGAMLLDHLGWPEAAGLARTALIAAVRAGTVTRDLARQMDDAKEITCSAFGREVRRLMDGNR